MKPSVKHQMSPDSENEVMVVKEDKLNVEVYLNP